MVEGGVIGVRILDWDDRRLSEGESDGDMSECDVRPIDGSGAVFGADGDVLIGEAVSPTVLISEGKMRPLRAPVLSCNTHDLSTSSIC